jgi:hypothetical protein
MSETSASAISAAVKKERNIERIENGNKTFCVIASIENAFDMFEQ